jgi:hypothetical protein
MTLITVFLCLLLIEGVNNGYKIKKSQKQNILTSEQAVLENMHCATFFNVLHMNKDLNVIESFQDAVLMVS